MPNEFRPVDLKSVLMKIIESRVRSEIFKMTESLFDPMQFTCRYKGGYKYRRGVEDATVTLMHSLFNHLEGKCKTFICRFFLCF